MTPEETAAAGEVIKAANRWLERFFGPAANEVGGMLGDWLRDKRDIMQHNRTRVAGKVQTIMLEESFEPKEMSSKVLLPMLEGISVEDDDTLQDMWANLFVNYIDSKKNLTVVVYPTILKQLSTSEVKILKYMGSEKRPRLWRYHDGHGPCPYTHEEANNLVRLSLIAEIIEQTPNNQKDGAGMINPLIKTKRTGKYELTEFGDNFLDACQRRLPTPIEKAQRRSRRI